MRQARVWQHCMAYMYALCIRICSKPQQHKCSTAVLCGTMQWCPSLYQSDTSCPRAIPTHFMAMVCLLASIGAMCNSARHHTKTRPRLHKCLPQHLQLVHQRHGIAACPPDQSCPPAQRNAGGPNPAPKGIIIRARVPASR
jgi:hypothetical protein